MLAVDASNAQAQGIHLGVKGGLNVAMLTGDAITSPDARVSFAAGGMLGYQFGHHITLQPEVLFAQKGIRDWTDGAGNPQGSIHTSYLEVPILVKFSMPPSGNPSVRPGFFAGPTFGMLLSCDASGTDCKEDFRDNDLGIVAGAALDFVRDFGMLTFDARVNFGRRHVLDPIPLGIADMKNRSYSVLIGAAIPILR
jgi:hypothetical protein